MRLTTILVSSIRQRFACWTSSRVLSSTTIMISGKLAAYNHSRGVPDSRCYAKTRDLRRRQKSETTRKRWWRVRL
ncbi:hypothetical protein FHX15_005972 [Rhizobium sp. BK650]|nr:hypothetical protein [Rhizobium sp. BK650]